MECSIICLSDADEKTKLEAIEVFVDSFYQVYKRLHKDKNNLTQFFLHTFRLERCYAAIYEGHTVGFCATCNGIQRSMQFKKDVCCKFMGKIKGSIGFYEMRYLLSKPNLEHETDLAIDYLATKQEYRGKGIGTILLKYGYEHLSNGEYFIDVASNNLATKRLYEAFGFVTYAKEGGAIPRMLGFHSILRMKMPSKECIEISDSRIS